MTAFCAAGARRNALLARLRRVTELDDADLAALDRACGASHQVAAETEIVRERQEPARVHFLLDGWAARQKLLPDGRRQLSAVLLPGDVADIDGLHLRRYDYGVVALTDCTFLSIERTELLRLVADVPALGQVVAWLGAVDHALLGERNACLGRRSAREHLAHLLCELYHRLAAVDRVNGESYLLPLTQEELSDTLGLTSVHVNRMLQGLRADGLMKLSNHRLTLLDRPALQRVGGFSPGYLHLDGMRRGRAPA